MTATCGDEADERNKRQHIAWQHNIEFIALSEKKGPVTFLLIRLYKRTSANPTFIRGELWRTTGCVLRSPGYQPHPICPQRNTTNMFPCEYNKHPVVYLHTVSIGCVSQQGPRWIHPRTRRAPMGASYRQETEGGWFFVHGQMTQKLYESDRHSSILSCDTFVVPFCVCLMADDLPTAWHWYEKLRIVDGVGESVWMNSSSRREIPLLNETFTVTTQSQYYDHTFQFDHHIIQNEPWWVPGEGEMNCRKTRRSSSSSMLNERVLWDSLSNSMNDSLKLAPIWFITRWANILQSNIGTYEYS